MVKYLKDRIPWREIEKNAFLKFTIEMVTYLDSVLENCPICLDPLGAPCSRIRACEKEFCEYWFEEQQGLIVYPEIKNRTDSIMLDLSLASECAFTGPTSFEPFPSFLLINKELRSKWGYLDNIAEAKKKGIKGQV